MINQECFFIVNSRGLVCWDYGAHKQYELSEVYAQRLVDLIYARCGLDFDNPIDCDFINNNILLPSAQVADAEWGWDLLSKIFHFGTKNIPIEECPRNEAAWAECYLAHCEKVTSAPSPIENNSSYTERGIVLPFPSHTTAVEMALEHRRTVRSFYNRPVDLEVVAHLLQYSLGFTRTQPIPESLEATGSHTSRRVSPSGGGLNATEGYLYANNVSGLTRGIYYYDPCHHALHLHSSELPPLGCLLGGQHFADDLPVGIFFTSRFDKLWWKYPHSRAYRMALIEVGHIAQTFQIIATDQGLKTWLTGAITEESLEPVLRVLNPAEQVMFFVGAGHSDGSVIPATLIQLMDAAGRGSN